MTSRIKCYNTCFILPAVHGSVEQNSTTLAGNATTEHVELVTYTGENLTCYHCKEDFKHVYKYNTPCQTKLVDVDLRACGASDRYCQVSLGN